MSRAAGLTTRLLLTGCLGTGLVSVLTAEAIAQSSSSCAALQAQILYNAQEDLALAPSCSGGNSAACSQIITISNQTIALQNQYNQQCGGSQATQTAGRTAVQATQVSLGAVNTHITNVRDSIENRIRQTGRPLGFAGSVSDDRIDTSFKALDASYNTLDNSLAALAFTDPKSPVLATKAPPAPSNFSVAGWAQGYVDYEDRSGFVSGVNIGRNTTTGGGVAGIDFTKLQLTSPTDAGVWGLITGDTSAFVRNADGSTAIVRGPSAGIYGVYVNGGFSVDGTFKTDFLSLGDDVGGVTTWLGLNNYTESGNISYKFENGNSFWEPTAGISDTETVWNAAAVAMGFTQGTDVRWTAGVRWGTSWDAQGAHWTGTLSALAYDDTIIRGGTVAAAAGAPMTPTGEGWLFGQFIGKLETQWNKNWSTYVEGEVRTHEYVFGTAGRVGLRYTFD